MRNTLIGLMALGIVGVGCNKSEEKPAEPAPAAPAAAPSAAPAAPAPAAGGESGGYSVVEVANGGTIAGSVKWTGAAPKLEDLKVTKDPNVCGKSKKNPRLIVSKGGGVANAYVYLADIKSGA